MKVLNKETGKTEEIDDSQLPSLIERGSVAIPDKNYDFTDDSGQQYSVPARDFKEAVNSGLIFKDSRIKKDEELEAKYGDSPVKALLYGGARGATLGVSDYLFSKTGAVSEEELSQVKSRNETASLIGDVAGTVLPAFATGGSSLLAKGLAKAPAGLLTAGAEYAGKRAAQNVGSQVVKAAAQLGVAGAVEGAVVGAGQVLSETSLGDAEFNAQALLSRVGTGALIGGALGGTVGAGLEYAKKAFKGGSEIAGRSLIDMSDLPAAEKASLKAQQKSKDEFSSLTNKIFENKELKEISARNGWPTTPGMETNFKPFQTLEKSLAEGASAPATAIASKIDDVNETVQKEITGLIGKGDEMSPLMAGDEVKKIITSDISSRIEPAKDFLNRFTEQFGNAPVSELIKKRAFNRISDLPSIRLGKNPKLGTAIEMLNGAQTYSDLEYVRKQIGQMASGIRRSGTDMDALAGLDDLYATVKRAQKDSIVKYSLELGPKRGAKLAKEVARGWDDAYKTYANVYKEYTPIAEQLGIKLRSPDTFLDDLAEAASEKIGQKMMDANDFRAMKLLSDKQPAIYEAARQMQLSKMAKSLINADGEFLPKSFAKKIQKLTSEQKQIFFGFDGKSDQRIDDLLKYIEKAPGKLNTSGTAISQFFQSILSPAYQATEYGRYLLYKGGENALKNHYITKMPILGSVEQAANGTKNKISSSISGFFRASRPGVSAASLEGLSEKKLDKAMSAYEDVQENPNEMLENFEKNNKDLLVSAPNTYQALQTSLIAGVQFLQSKTPKVDEDYMIENRKPSRSELMKFSDYVEAVEKPSVIYDQLSQGYVNSNTVEALKVVYPKILEGLIAEVNAKKPKIISRTQAGELHKLTGVKTTPAWDYDKMMILQGKTPNSQAANQQAEAEMSSKVPVSGAKEINSAGRTMSGFDRTVNRT